MTRNRPTILLTSILFSVGLAHGQCRHSIVGTVRDPTSAAIPNAMITLNRRVVTHADSSGHFFFSCVQDGHGRLRAYAEGFAPAELYVVADQAGTVMTLKLATVEATIDVTAQETSSQNDGATRRLTGKALESLAEDREDLRRELSQLAAIGGANPSAVIFTVDGFQDSASLPSKSQIASIDIDPDLYSAEYATPPYNGGRIEIHTKPGEMSYHGALFATNGSSFENARDPFSASRSATGKQRYGFELTGPVIRRKLDFLLGSEYRAIHEFGIVDAVTISPNGQFQSVSSNVPQPQRLWSSTARLDWQATAAMTATFSYSGSVEANENVEAGGLASQEAGYDSKVRDHVLRTNIQTVLGSHAVWVNRASLRWWSEADLPNSLAPQLQVAGSFIAGGNSRGAETLGTRTLEFGSEATVAVSRHTVKAGLQLIVSTKDDQLTAGFNGSYLFAGGNLPILDINNQPTGTGTVVISGLEQYRRTLLHLAGGQPTSYSQVSGSPGVHFSPIVGALFVQDDWDMTKSVHASIGMRYAAQSNPTLKGALTPRLGISWAASKSLTLHAHAGFFSSAFSATQYEAIRQFDGVSRRNLLYSPQYLQTTSFADPVETVTSFSPHFSVDSSLEENIGGSQTLRGGWNISFDMSFSRIRNGFRLVNVNSPLDGTPFGKRPGPQDTNILEEQNSGKGTVDAEVVVLSQQSQKRIQFFAGVARIHQVDDLDTPQIASSSVGEFARHSGLPVLQGFGNAIVNLPMALSLSLDFHGSAQQPYNIITGFDNNGDGTFNDRPQFATLGQHGAISTPFGALVSEGGRTPIPRNRGSLPLSLFLDANLQRTFFIGKSPTADTRQQKLTLSIRSSNLLNHTNVTQVGNILGSPLFGEPFAASPGRRIEASMRYSF